MQDWVTLCLWIQGPSCNSSWVPRRSPLITNSEKLFWGICSFWELRSVYYPQKRPRATIRWMQNVAFLLSFLTDATVDISQSNAQTSRPYFGFLHSVDGYLSPLGCYLVKLCTFYHLCLSSYFTPFDLFFFSFLNSHRGITLPLIACSVPSLVSLLTHRHRLSVWFGMPLCAGLRILLAQRIAVLLSLPNLLMALHH